MEKAITRFRNEYGFLSNMYSVNVEWDGRTYRNSEAAFQSAKTLDPGERDAFCGLTGVAAKRLGRKMLLRPDWWDVRVGVMEEVVRAKFTQNPGLAEKLVATGDAPLLEGNTWHDTFWGVDSKTLEGENHLGVILMRVREELCRGDLLEKEKKRRAEREEQARKAAEETERERQELLARLARIPEYDFEGMEVGTRAFGRGQIIRREGDYLIVSVRGQEKRFALPGCIVQGFLIPDDKSIAENLALRQTILSRLAEIEKQTANNQ